MNHLEAREIRNRQLIAEHGEVKMSAAINLVSYADGAIVLDVVYDPVPLKRFEKSTFVEVLAEEGRLYITALIDRAFAMLGGCVEKKAVSTDQHGHSTTLAEELREAPKYSTDPQKYDA